MSSGNSEGRDGANEQVAWKIKYIYKFLTNTNTNTKWRDGAGEQVAWKMKYKYKSGACDEDAPDPVEAVLSGCQAKQEGQVHQGNIWPEKFPWKKI